MIIDLHCHTKKAKSGDLGREVNFDKFKEKITEAKVEIVALTNHNMFDENQYEEFSKGMYDKHVLVLPGIELDVEGTKSGKSVYGHVIVIADPSYISDFIQLVNTKCVIDPDKFSISVEDFCNTFGKLKNAIIMCHYKKSKEITYKDFLFIKDNIDKSNAVLLEPSNSRKAGIIIKEDREASWFGSDNHSWDTYPISNSTKKLPECIFNIRDYNALLSLLKNNQDAVLLKTFLNQRGPEILHISPFKDLSLNLELYRSTNVVFGAKATGKTEILKAIEKEFISKGKNVSTFYIENKSQDLNTLLDYIPNEDDLKDFRNSKCDSEISIIKDWAWKELPTLKKFYDAKKNEEALSIRKKAKIVNAKFLDVLDDSNYKDKMNEYNTLKDSIEEIISFNKTEILAQNEIKTLDNLLSLLIFKAREKVFELYFDYKAKYLEKYSIEYIGNKIANIQGAIKAPSTYGLVQVYEEEKKLEKSITKILKSLEKQVVLDDYKIGILPTKGVVNRITKIGFRQQKKSSHSEYKVKMCHNLCKKDDVNQLEKKLTKVISSTNISNYLDNINDLINHLKDKSISDLMFYVNYINIYKTKDNDDFKPSNGEASILLVDYAINNPKADVIILDEPDSGMGADYINQILIPSINEQAANNKIIVISTHDPNLVVRTHPYQCVYREEYAPNEYSTYCGSSFEENMVNFKDDDDLKNWTKTCIEKCEGGEEAITERERTYGHY